MQRNRCRRSHHLVELFIGQPQWCHWSSSRAPRPARRVTWGGAKTTPFSISSRRTAVVDRLEDADHLDAVPGELPRPRSIRPLDKPCGGGVKLGDAAISYSMSLNGAGVRFRSARHVRYNSYDRAEDLPGRRHAGTGSPDNLDKQPCWARRLLVSRPCRKNQPRTP